MVSPLEFPYASNRLPMSSRRPPLHDTRIESDLWISRFFFGPGGLRAGWRALLAVFFFLAFSAILGGILLLIPPVRAWVAHVDRTSITPGFLIFGDAPSVAAALLAAFAMSLLEGKSFTDYGMPLRAAFGKRFWQGALYGLAMLSLLMALIATLHGFSFGNLAVQGSAAARYGVLYGVGFLLVAFFEEFTYRGYLQATLGSGIGFWPAAVVLSIFFGVQHLANPGESRYGVLMVGCFGLLAAFALRRTGDIWFAFGMHAAWDWAETFLYGVSDSGAAAKGHLLNSSLHGPDWLTGGSTGPEGSLLVFAVMVAAAVGIHYLFKQRQIAI